MALSLRDRFKLGRQIVKRWQDKTWNAMSINLLLRDFGLEEVDFEHWGGNEEIAERVSSATDKQLREMYRTTFGAALEEVDKVARLARCKRRFIEAALRPPVHVARGNPQGIRWRDFRSTRGRRRSRVCRARHDGANKALARPNRVSTTIRRRVCRAHPPRVQREPVVSARSGLGTRTPIPALLPKTWPRPRGLSRSKTMALRFPTNPRADCEPDQRLAHERQ